MTDILTPAPANAWPSEALRDRVGRTASASDTVRLRDAQLLQDVLGLPWDGRDGDPAPLGLHWSLAPPAAPLGELQPDGHPKAAGGVLPPTPGLRRMWAGGELNWRENFRIGAEVTRRSTFADLQVKEGRSGPLVFVQVRHDYTCDGRLLLEERQDIVYRPEAPAGDAGPGAAARAPQGHAARRLPTHPVQLFRYSALTGNAHRIHYDQPYATSVEGYPGLVVHGPLQATALMQAAAVVSGRPPAHFAYRAVAPLFCGDTLTIWRGDAAGEVWTSGDDGRLAMRAAFSGELQA